MRLGRRRGSVVTAAVFGILLATGCRYGSYGGDGVFSDRGWLSGSGRYVLDLGSIDLATTGVRTYTVAKLPEERFALGFEVEPVRDTYSGRAPFSPVVEVAFGAPGVPLVAHRGPLDGWITSTSLENSTRAVFVYCGGPKDAGWAEVVDTAWG